MKIVAGTLFVVFALGIYTLPMRAATPLPMQVEIFDPVSVELHQCESRFPVWENQRSTLCYERADKKYHLLLKRLYPRIMHACTSRQRRALARSQKDWLRYRQAWHTLRVSRTGGKEFVGDTFREDAEATRLRLLQLLTVRPGFSGEARIITQGLSS